jgi:hypothetical protein
MASGKYGDTESVLDEVILLFSGSEDQQLISSIRQVERETKELSARKQAELKETIRGATRGGGPPRRRRRSRRRARAERERSRTTHLSRVPSILHVAQRSRRSACPRHAQR